MPKLNNNIQDLIFNSEFKHWKGNIFLPAWKNYIVQDWVEEGYVQYTEKLEAKKLEAISKGLFPIRIENSVSQIEMLSYSIITACDSIIKNQNVMKEKILQAILGYYHEKIEEVATDYNFCSSEIEEFLPKDIDTADLKSMISLAQVHIHTITKNDVAYIGYEFEYIWEEEHGLGILTLGNEIIEIGSANVDFEV